VSDTHYKRKTYVFSYVIEKVTLVYIVILQHRNKKSVPIR